MPDSRPDPELQERRAQARLLIATQNLHKVYRLDKTRVPALRGVDMAVGEGEFVAVVGPSGSGKSTLLHILGLVDTASEGEVFFDGRRVADLSERQRAALRLRHIGFIFQTFNLFPNLTAQQNVEIPMRLAGEPRSSRRARASQLLAAVGLGQRLNHRPPELSGGERQRVAIARALANRPRLILADEPTGNLDSATGAEIVDILRSLNQQGQTIVMVTHNVEVASRATRLLHMRDGQIQSPSVVN